MVQTFEVANVRCGGCAATIREALDLEGFTSVKVDIISNPRKVSADIKDEADLERFKKVLRKHGYPLFDEENDFLDSASLKAKSFVSCAVGKFSTKEEDK